MSALEFHISYGPPVVAKHVTWTKLKNGNWQSGNLQIRLVSTSMLGSHRFESWGIWIRTESRWLQCYTKSRPWYYGSAGQAKRGIPKIHELTFGIPPRVT